ncbi:hypothetical protein CBS101457_000929 [Exobasidium rhododendri]|nr:hypothetical protein CBS101457_000929 [Exobasidium rhododendri]
MSADVARTDQSGSSAEQNQSLDQDPAPEVEGVASTVQHVKDSDSATAEDAARHDVGHAGVEASHTSPRESTRYATASSLAHAQADVSGREDSNTEKEMRISGKEEGGRVMGSAGVAAPLTGPACLVNFTERVQTCSLSVQAWSERQDEKAREKRNVKSGKEVIFDENGIGIEPNGDSWLKRKGIIFVVAIILSWVYLVFTWRICVAGIRNEPRALISRRQGIGLLVGLNVLWLTTLWTYIRVILTGPGYVRDHVPISAAPAAPSEVLYVAPAAYPSAFSATSKNAEPANEHTNGNLHAQTEEPVDAALPAIVGPVIAGQAAKVDEERDVQRREEESIVPTSWQQHEQTPITMTASGVPEPYRVPPQSAPLNSSNLYCYRCKRYKPPRAHHCRHCATCVLKMDHHCPWVGGCVGARNHKYFYHFIQWVTLLEIYVLITNAIVFSRGINRRSADGPGWEIDGYMISLFPITAMFTLFTMMLFITHTYLFVLNLTTLEHLSYDRMKTREDILLTRYLDARKDSGEKKMTFGDKLKEKKRMKGKWAEQWGNLKTEANLWWIDDEEKARKSDPKKRSWYHSIGPNWKQALGESWYQWILPIGRAKSDGLTYESNWRFGKEGLWRRREKWAGRDEQWHTIRDVVK